MHMSFYSVDTLVLQNHWIHVVLLERALWQSSGGPTGGGGVGGGTDLLQWNMIYVGKECVDAITLTSIQLGSYIIVNN